MKALPMGSSRTSILSRTLVPLTPTGPRRFSGFRKKPVRTKLHRIMGILALFIEGKESHVDLLCFSFHSFRRLLFFIENLENPENA
jgi:hypothetical protein